MLHPHTQISVNSALNVVTVFCQWVMVNGEL